jgi:hypothetical protein
MRSVAVFDMYVYAIALSIFAALHSWHDGQPRLNLRGTIITGKRLQPSHLDFFGGQHLFIITPLLLNPSFLRYSFRRASSRGVSPLASSPQAFPFSLAII